MSRYLLLLCLILPMAVHADDQQLATFDHCTLDSGEVIESCVVGYHTRGTLNAAGSNAIVIPTWFTGKSADLLMWANADFLDPERYFLVFVDALGNGVSSSPSNSAQQPGGDFPEITIGDMVTSQHRLLTEKLGIDHLYAVFGLSMGGMQAFEWGVRYPGFADRIVSVIGSPKLAAYDLANWETLRQLLVLKEQCDCQEARTALAGLGFLIAHTPEYHERESDPDTVLEQLNMVAPGRDFGGDKPVDTRLQAKAMMTHDIYRSFAGDKEATAAAMTAELLVIVGEDDHVVTPGPAIEFAGLHGAELVVMDNDCGHSTIMCQPDVMVRSTIRFLGHEAVSE